MDWQVGSKFGQVCSFVVTQLFLLVVYQVWREYVGN